MERKKRQYYFCYPEGKNKALTFSYDDGRTADRKLIELFNEYGVKGTFHLNGGLLDGEDKVTKKEIKQLYQGHEIAAHTYTHPTISRCPLDKVIEEVLEDRKVLESIVKYPVCGFSYPNGAVTPEIQQVLPALGIDYARVVGQTNQFSLPDNWYEWKSTCHHNRDLMELGETFQKLNKTQYLFLMYVWGHSYEFDQDKNWKMIENFLKKITISSNIWYTTNRDFCHYMKAVRKMKFAASGEFVYNPTALDLWIRVDQKIVRVKSGQQVEV